MATCKICGEPYEPRNSSQKTCGKADCQREQKRLKAVGRKIPRPAKERRCTICGAVFQPRQPNHVLCDDPKCKAKARLIAARERYARGVKLPKRKCPICGVMFQPKRPDQKTCGTLSCSRRVGAKAREAKKEERHCAQCWAPFKVDKSSTRKFCCKLCEKEWKDAQKSLETKIPDIWPNLETLPPGCRSWYQAEMMPVL